MKTIIATTLAIFALSACSTDPGRELMRPDVGDENNSSMTNNGSNPDGGNTSDGSADNNGTTDDGGGTEDSGGDGDDVGGGGDAENNNNGVCRPNRDGLIERSEVDFVVGASAKFMVAEDVDFDTAGTMENNTRVWDLAQDFTGEYLDVLELRDPTGKWFETVFPDATYATPLSGSSDLLGVFQATPDELLLLGVVSPDDGFFRTELEYDPPVPVLKFPMKQGDTWNVETDVSGQYEGTIAVYDEVYDFEVDAEGVLQTDFGNFQVLRVRSTLDQQIGLVNTIVRSFAFVTECFGTVATITSLDNEDQVEFTQVSELRRIAP